MLISGRYIGFFTGFYWAVFYGIGFTVFLSLRSIFYKLSFRSISLVYYPIVLAFFYRCVEPKFSVGVLAGLLLTSLVSSAVSVI